MVSFALVLVVAAQLTLGSPLGGQAAAAGAPTAPIGQAEVFETQLPPYQASLKTISDAGVKLEVGKESRTIPFEQLLRTRLNPAGTSTPPAKGELIQVELVDGSRLACSQIASDGKTLTISWSDGGTLVLPNKAVAGCLLKSLTKEVMPQWEAIAESRLTTDVLVLTRADALDKVEGIIGKIDDKSVAFTLDGQALNVARTKLTGFRFFTPAGETRGKLLAVIRDSRGSEWMAAKIDADFSKASAKLKTVGGVELELPLNVLTEMDFSFGSMRFLADLPSLERRVMPRLTLGANIAEAEKLFGPQAVMPERLRGATAGPGVDFLGAGSVTYRIPADFKRLLGNVVLSTPGARYLPCTVQVQQEDKVLFEQTLTKTNEPVAIDLPVEPGKRLRLTVTTEPGTPVGDYVSFQQLRFVK